MKVQPVGNTARSTIFFHDNASPTGMRDRSKVKKTVPAQGTLPTSCGKAFGRFARCEKLTNFLPTLLPDRHVG